MLANVMHALSLLYLISAFIFFFLFLFLVRLLFQYFFVLFYVSCNCFTIVIGIVPF
jgi:hypothetical protein